MANKVTIDVEARFVDNITDESRAASKAVEGIGKEAEKTQKKVDNLGKKKVSPVFDADNNKFLKKMRSMEDKMSKMGRTKTAAVLDVIDKATNKIGKVLNKAQSFKNKVFQSALKIKDSDALSSIKKISSGLETITKKTWTGLVKIKDMALAPIKAIKNALFSIPTLITAVVSAKVIQKGVLEPIGLADQYSGAKIGFETLLGESRAQQMMNEIDIFAKKTPFKTSGVISNVQKMMAYGWDVERVIEDMEILGDAAASTGKGDEGLSSIVYALSEIRSKGKLSTQELNQLASAGIKAKAYLAKGLGFGTDDAGMKKLAEALEDGAVGANQAIDLILEGMKEFDGMMDKTANETVQGLKSQLEDVFEINIARRWGQGLQDGAKRGLGTVVSLLDDAGESLGALGDSLYEIGQLAANWVADKLENAVKRVKDITDTYEFQHAGVGEKISMLWNGVVADPISDWWNGGGKEKVLDTAQEVGLWIGKAILDGISFAWQVTPWWGKLLIGGWAAGKTISGLGNVAGGISNIISGVSGLGGVARGIIGSTGNYMVGGTGIAGALASLGYKFSGGASAGADISGGMAAVRGLAGITGTAMAISGIVGGLKDIRKSVKGNYEGDPAAGAYGARGLLTIGGVVGGAALGGSAAIAGTKIGAIVGSIVPGLGTAIGAAVGAGLGALGGKFFGDMIVKNAEAKKYESKSMQDAIKSEESAEVLAEKFAKARWENAREHFGKIKLEASEIERLVNQMVWGDSIEYFDNFTAATKSAEANLESMKSTAEEINRWMWKAGLGVKFNADEIEAITASFTDYISSGKSLLENKHYEFSMAVGVAFDKDNEFGKTLLKDGNEFFENQKKEFDKLGQELGTTLTKALADGIIQAEEKDAISAIQEKMNSIIEQSANQDMIVNLELAKLKLGEGNMDSDSYAQFIDTATEQLQARIDANQEALTLILSRFEFKYDDNGEIINMDEFRDYALQVYENNKPKIDKLKLDVMNFEIAPLAEAYGEDILPDGTTEGVVNLLKNSLTRAINMDKDPIEWDIKDLLQISAELPEETAANLKESLSDIFNQMGMLEFDVDTLLKLSLKTEEGTTEKTKNAVDNAIPDTVAATTDVTVTANPLMQPVSVNPNGLIALTSQTAYPTLTVSPILNILRRNVSTNDLITRSDYRGGIEGGSSAMSSFFRGGMVRGGSRLIEVAEEGNPEMIIPLSSQRRGRALKLWAQAGNIMGVPGFARGGMTDGSYDEGIRFQRYNGSDSASAGQPIQIDIGGLTFEINVNSNDAQGITEAIKAQAEEIAEVVAGVLADALGSQYANTPARGGVA